MNPNLLGDGAPSDHISPSEAADGHSDTPSNNPYSNYYQRSGAPDLDSAAPQLKSHEIRRMNRHALLLLVAVVLLLLFVAYWMITSVGHHDTPTKPREEKVTVAEAPRPPVLPSSPQLPSPPPPLRKPEAIPLAQPVLPPLPPRQPLSVAPSAPRAPTLLERRIIDDRDVSQPGQQSATTGQPFGAFGPQGALKDSSTTSAQPLMSPDMLMQRGTYIRCVMETRIVSDVAGYSSCLVTEPVYSFNGHRLLLPKGSKVLGSYDKSPIGHRIAVVWDRIITPNGTDVNMASPGIDSLGGAGLPGQYDAHWGSRIGSALLISMLSDAFKYEAAEHGPRSTAITNGVVTQEPFESNTAQTVQNLANQAVQSAANRPPTVTINQGTIIYIYVAKDVDFSGVLARL